MLEYSEYPTEPKRNRDNFPIFGGHKKKIYQLIWE